MILRRLFRSSFDEIAALIYRRLVAQARQPVFYSAYGVPDTVDGRFEMIALHVFLLLHRLKSQEGGAADLSQALFDTMFADMDRSLREMGAGDLGVGRRVKAMAEGLYGRIAAYEAGLAADDAALSAALRRNLFGTLRDAEPPPAALAGFCAYLRQAVALLAAQPVDGLERGELTFPVIGPI